MAAGHGQGGDDGGEGMMFVIGIIFIAFLLVWKYFPWVFIVPEWYIKLAMTAVLAPFSPDNMKLFHQMWNASPMLMDKSKAMSFLSQGNWNAVYAFIGAAMLVVAARKASDYSEAKQEMTPQKQAEFMSKDPKFPHLIPFIDVNPLNFSETEGQMRFPDKMDTFAIRNKIIQGCPSCGYPVYEWEDGTYSCESRHINMNMGMGDTDDYCRYRFTEKPEISGFQVRKCKWIFVRELNHLGVLPENVSDIPGYFGRRSIWAMGVLGIAISKTIEEDDEKLGSPIITMEIAKLMAQLSDGVIEDGPDAGKGILNKRVAHQLYEYIDSYLTPDVMGQFKHIADRHYYGTTFLCGMVFNARKEKGVLSTALFGHMLWFDRRLFIILNNIGRPTPFTEGAASYSHFNAEKALGEKINEDNLQLTIDVLINAYSKSLGYGKQRNIPAMHA